MMESERKRSSSLETFLKWATKLGITDSSLLPNLYQSQTEISSCLGQSLYVSHFEDSGGRGLAAVRDLQKGELILRVPKSALMTTESLIGKDDKLSCCLQRHTHLSSTQILSVCLLAEMGKGRSSWWHPYLMQLPRHYDTLASFTWFEIQALQVDAASWAAEKAISKAESDWKATLPLMKELNLKPQILTFRSWLWASATVSSRTMHIPWDDAGCLCPVGDFFNYTAPEEESFYSEDVESCTKDSSLKASFLWEDKDLQKQKLVKEQLDDYSQRLTDAGYEEDVDAYCFYARKNYREGEQVLLSYGTYTNLELLEHYGFLLNKNPNEKALIQLRSEIDPNLWPKDSLYIQQDGKPSFALLCALRLWATPQSLRKSISHLAYSGLQVSLENEIHIMKWVGNNCRDVLKLLPSSIEDDVLLLEFIEKMHGCPVDEVEKMLLLVCGRELGDFFEANDSHGELTLSKKVRRSIERWKLAVQWRIRYKQILVDCISYCKETINILSCKNVPCQRTKHT